MKALALLSGGLDSILAIRLVQKQDIQVEGICFVSTFFGDEHARAAAHLLNIPLHLSNITEELLRIIKSPPHGFGRGANPCIDCHALMFKQAGSMMNKHGAQFLITGEVLGERPKSQSRRALAIVDRQSGFGGYIVRPLSAQCLDATVPEREGWLDRSQLLAITGRSRKIQFNFAKNEGITDFPIPAGGCLLADPNYARRIKYIVSTGKLNANEAELLKVGRHFHFNHTAHLVIGRNRSENARILALATPGDVILEVRDHAGPVSLLRGMSPVEQIRRAGAFAARYSDAPEETGTTVRYRHISTDETGLLQVRPADPDEILRARIEESQ